MDKPPKIRKIKVEVGDKSMEVLIPESGDKSYDDYLEEAEREKTAEQLRKQPPKPKSKVSKEDIASAIKERMEFDKRKRRGDIRKYY